MLDDNDAVAFLHKAVKDLNQQSDIIEMQSRRWLVEYQKGFFAAFAGEVVDEFETLGFAAR